MHQDATETGGEQAGGECLFFFYFLSYDVNSAAFGKKQRKKEGKNGSAESVVFKYS